MDKVFIACGATDLRKSVDGLAAIVQVSFQLNPFSSHLFVFCNQIFLLVPHIQLHFV
ncbi:IS66 family insertion sequence element accessory protein TnpB [Lysinibacillus sp. TE18511]